MDGEVLSGEVEEGSGEVDRVCGRRGHSETGRDGRRDSGEEVVVLVSWTP